MESGRPGTLSWTVFRGSGVEVLDCFEQVGGIQERAFKRKLTCLWGPGFREPRIMFKGAAALSRGPSPAAAAALANQLPRAGCSQPDAPVITPDALS